MSNESKPKLEGAEAKIKLLKDQVARLIKRYENQKILIDEQNKLNAELLRCIKEKLELFTEEALRTIKEDFQFKK